MGRTQDADRLVAFLGSLRTVRFFEPNPVPQSALDDVLEVARSSGSARNRQPWEFVVVRDRRTLGRLTALEGYAQHLSGAAAGIVLVMAGEPGKLEQETFDEGRLAERIFLAAASHGLGGAVSWFAGEARNEAKRILGVPSERLVRTTLSLGHPDPDPPSGMSALSPGRKPMAELLHEERYGRRLPGAERRGSPE